jgi:LmbE family N-acetylglucosaminyl deacetylase
MWVAARAVWEDHRMIASAAPKTLVFVHAHPDDEALLTAGTMARAAAEGQRVVLVVATDGAAGLASSDMHEGGLAARRDTELEESCDALGVHRLVRLGYADSGLDGDEPQRDGGAVPLCAAPLQESASALAAVLVEEAADVVVTYDANGGYGHPDHVRVHEMGVRAAEMAGTSTVFEATVPRDQILRGIRLASKVYRFPPEFDPTSFERAFTASADVTHRVDVRRYIDAKRASMAAHVSQATADGGADRTLAAFLRMPRPLFRRVFGTEYYRLRP